MRTRILSFLIVLVLSEFSVYSYGQELVYHSKQCHREALLRNERKDVIQNQDLGYLNAVFSIHRHQTNFTLYEHKTGSIQRFEILDRNETKTHYEYLIMVQKDQN